MEQLHINQVIEQLIVLGEDKDELEYWQSIYEDLDPQQKTEIYQNLTEELKALT